MARCQPTRRGVMDHCLCTAPTFAGNRHVPLPIWGYGVAWKDLGKLQPMREVLQ
jgi:hypothetical protein